MSKVFVNYIRLLFLPFNLRPNYTVAISYSLFEREVIISILILLFCFGLGILMYKFNKLIFFSLFYFLICLVPVSNIVPISALMAERFLYLPLLGFCILVAVIIEKAKEKSYIFFIFFASLLFLPHIQSK
ncbi:MAG: hypothetical protein QXL51_05125 [Candidatus Aenigmatarchaeota archaeon]